MALFGQKPVPATPQATAASGGNGADADVEIPIGSADSIGGLGRERIAAMNGEMMSADRPESYIDGRIIGLEPVGIVVGKAVYHIGLAPAKWDDNRELEYLTQALYNGRLAAESRMLDEAQQLGADGVIDITVELNRWNWAEDLADIEFRGTAVRYVGDGQLRKCPDGRPFTTAGTATALWWWFYAGYQPVRYVFGSCVYHLAHQGVRSTISRVGRNVELIPYTQALYDARELALTRVQTEAKSLGASALWSYLQSVHQRGWGAHVLEFLVYASSVLENPTLKGSLPDPRAQLTRTGA